MKNKLSIVIACVGVLAFSAPDRAAAATKKMPSPAPNPSTSPAAKSTAPSTTEKAVRAIPFRGKIAAVDLKARTFTIAGKEKSRVFKITNRTMLTKAGATATMKDVVVNEEVRGSYWKVTDGSLEAKTVKLGPLTETEKAAEEARKKKRAEKKAAAAAATTPAVSPASSPAPTP